MEVERRLTGWGGGPTSRAMAEPTKADDSGARQSLELAHVLFIDLVGYSLLATDAQGRILREHQDGEAATEFQKLLEHRGLRRASPLGPRAQLGLARAYAMAGEAAQAKAAYQEFFTLWKDADTGVSLVTEVNTEYRKLE